MHLILSLAFIACSLRWSFATFALEKVPRLCFWFERVWASCVLRPLWLWQVVSDQTEMKGVAYVYAHMCVLSRVRHPVTPRLLCPWDFPGKNIRVGCHSRLRGIFPTQGLNPSLWYWQADSLPLSHLRRHVYMYVHTPPHIHVYNCFSVVYWYSSD